MNNHGKAVIAAIDPVELGLTVHARTGGEFVVNCPFHNDGKPSACFNPISGLFFCFACGAASTAERLALKLGGRLVTKVWSTRREKSPEWRQLLGGQIAIGHRYLASRKVTDEQITRHRIRSSPGAVVFPVTNREGRDVGVIVRRESGTPRYLFFGEKPPLWPMHELNDLPPGSRVYVVEGVFGKLRAERAGLNAVAVMGASVREEIALHLRNYDVVAVFDHDFAGYAGTGRLISFVPLARVVIPGREADEMTRKDWRTLDAGITAREADLTRSLAHLARLSGDAARFMRQLPRKAQRRNNYG